MSSNSQGGCVGEQCYDLCANGEPNCGNANAVFRIITGFWNDDASDDEDDHDGHFCRRVVLQPAAIMVSQGSTDWGVHLQMPGLNGTYRQIGIFKYGFFVRKQGFHTSMGSENWPSHHAGLQPGQPSTFWVKYTPSGVLTISEGSSQRNASLLYKFRDPHSSILPTGLSADGGYHCTMAARISDDCAAGGDDDSGAWEPDEADQCLSPVTYIDYESVAALDLVQVSEKKSMIYDWARPSLSPPIYTLLLT